MVQSSFQLVLTDLLTYLIVGVVSFAAVATLMGIDPHQQVEFSKEMTLSSGILLFGLCYMVGYFVRAIRDWVEIPFINKEGEYRTPCKQVLYVVGFQFCEFSKNTYKRFDELSDLYSELLLEKFPRLEGKSQDLIDYIEDDFSERNHTDGAYLSRLGTLETFAGSMALVLFVFGLGAMFRAFVSDWDWFCITGFFSLLIALLCWVEQEQLNLEIRVKKASQAITWLLMQKTSVPKTLV